MNNMNQYIKNVVKRMYQIDVDTASKEQLEAIEEINVSDITMNSEVTTWNFSEFPNLKKIDCSYLFIKDLITTGCTELEYLRWEGVRGNDIHLDLSTNKKLKKVVGGQDGILFVNEDFNESIIEDHTRQYSYYTYKLIKVSEGSKEQKFLNEVKAMKEKILSIPVDRKGKYVAILHYALMDKLNNL